MLLDKLKAVYPGEIREKIKRNLQKILFPKSLLCSEKVPLDLNVSKKTEISLNGLKFTNKIFNENKLFLLGKEYALSQIKWDIKEKKDKKFWFKESISDYKDVKEIWEINRLQFLTQFAIKSKIENDIKLEKTIIQIFENWLEENTFDMV